MIRKILRNAFLNFFVFFLISVSLKAQDSIVLKNIGGTSYAIYFYKNVGLSNFIVPEGIEEVEYLVLAGGGGGGGIALNEQKGAGGGGAGGFLSNVGGVPYTVFQSVSYPVAVGGGGFGGSDGVKGGSGDNSFFSSIVSIGGAGGASSGTNNIGANGGSGGGDRRNGNQGGQGVVGQGRNGGRANGALHQGAGGGGGGAVGGNADIFSGGDGGNGLINAITGDDYFYAGGGGGGGGYQWFLFWSQWPGGVGGVGGGGGSPVNRGGGSHCLPNSGSGGGGATASFSGQPFNGGNGGSGAVIIRYQLSSLKEVSFFTDVYVVNNGVVTDGDIIMQGNSKLEIFSGASLTIPDDVSLTIHNNASLENNGNLIVTGDLISNGGLINSSDGNVFVNGTIQDIPAMVVKNLTIDGLGEKFLLGNIEVVENFYMNQVFNLNNNNLVLLNNATDAIVRNSGHIIAETPNFSGKVKWFIGSVIDTYSVPFGYDNEYMPVTIELTNNNMGALGYIAFSTYGTDSNNEPRPDIVNHLGNTPINYVCERFWFLDYFFNSKSLGAPIEGHLIFTYLDDEMADVDENNMIAQRYNNINDVWGDTWLPRSGGANIINRTGTFRTPLIEEDDFFNVWILSDLDNPLPIDLLIFEAKCRDDVVDIKWVTATESNNDFFSVQKSFDGLIWETIEKVVGANNSTSERYYEVSDAASFNSILYYRLKQTDFDGSSKIFNPTVVKCNNNTSVISIYPNPASEFLNVTFNAYYENITISIYNILGKCIDSKFVNLINEEIFLIDVSNLSAGYYLIDVSSYNKSYFKDMFFVK